MSNCQTIASRSPRFNALPRLLRLEGIYLDSHQSPSFHDTRMFLSPADMPRMLLRLRVSSFKLFPYSEDGFTEPVPNLSLADSLSILSIYLTARSPLIADRHADYQEAHTYEHYISTMLFGSTHVNGLQTMLLLKTVLFSN